MKAFVHSTLRIGLVAALISAGSDARAEPSARDGYCDQVEGVAGAQSALLLAPEVFATAGYVDQAAVGAPDASNDTRVTLGVSYSLSHAYQGLVTRARGKAECRRHQALAQARTGTAFRGLAARTKVLEDALAEGEKLLAAAKDDLAERRSTAQEVSATQLRVDELRELAVSSRLALDALPSPAIARQPMGGALAAYYRADADVERHEGRLRRAQAWDLSVRVGYDKFSGNDDRSPYIAMVSARFNLGWLLQGGANDRAAAGRRRLITETGQGSDAALGLLRTTLELETQREEQSAVLEADLAQQVEALGRLGGDSGRRYRQTVWFEWIKVKAEHAYLEAHVASLREALGEASP